MNEKAKKLWILFEFKPSMRSNHYHTMYSDDMERELENAKDDIKVRFPQKTESVTIVDFRTI